MFTPTAEQRKEFTGAGTEVGTRHTLQEETWSKDIGNYSERKDAKVVTKY